MTPRYHHYQTLETIYSSYTEGKTNFNYLQFISKLYTSNTEKAPIKATFDRDLFRLKVNEKGQKGFLSFLKVLKSYDKTGKMLITLLEYRKAIKDFKLSIPSAEIDESFRAYDSEFNGKINILKLITDIRGCMNSARKDLIEKAYSSLEQRYGSSITISTLKEKYYPKLHPAVIEGRKTPESALQEFIETLEILNTIVFDSSVSINKEKFIEYYEYISSSIEKQDYFENMIRNVWQLEQPKEVVPVALSKPISSTPVLTPQANSTSYQNIVILKNASIKPDVVALFMNVRTTIISRGIASTINFIRQMKIYDTKKKGNIDVVDFVGIFNTCKLGVAEKDINTIKQIFENLELRVSIDEFYNALVGTLHPKRAALVEAAYKEIDKTNVGYIDMGLVNKIYNTVSKTELQSKSGKKMLTEDIIYEFKEYLDGYLHVIKGRKNDGRILKEEFLSYYILISSVIEDDMQFESMMVTLWKIPQPAAEIIAPKEESTAECKPLENIPKEEPKTIATQEIKQEEAKPNAEAKKEEEKKEITQEPMPVVEPKEKEIHKEEQPIEKNEPKQQEAITASNEQVVHNSEELTNLRQKITKRGVRAVFGLIRGLKSYDITGKGLVSVESLSKFIIGYAYQKTEQEAKTIANAIIKECNNEFTIFDIVCLLFGDQDKRRDILETIFEKFEAESVEVDKLKAKLNIKAEGTNKDEDTIYSEYIDTLEEYIVAKGIIDRKVNKSIFVAYHVLYTIMWDLSKINDIYLL